MKLIKTLLRITGAINIIVSSYIMLFVPVENYTKLDLAVEISVFVSGLILIVSTFFITKK